MIITRTPLRITLGGGGTDLPSYYERFGGLVISAAISRHIYIALNRTFTDDFFLKYSALERVGSIEEIEHPIIREAFRRHDPGTGIEVASSADIPSGTGLGSSGSFTVGLLRALAALRREHATAESLAAEACQIEIEDLQRTVGKQDQYIASYGGLTVFDFKTDGSVGVSPLAIPTPAMLDLETHLTMFFTGYSRDADKVLSEQVSKSKDDDASMLDNLHTVKDLGQQSQKALEDGDTEAFARLMHVHWQHKKKRSSGMSNPDIDRWYDLGMANGALGGKLVGAGAGGFLLFYATDVSRLRRAMSAEGLAEVRFTFDLDGSTVLVRD